MHMMIKGALVTIGSVVAITAAGYGVGKIREATIVDQRQAALKAGAARSVPESVDFASLSSLPAPVVRYFHMF